MTASCRIAGLGEIARDFDAMLIDQFGVIHDGQKLYPGAAGALSELHGLGIPVIVMTNSGKRAASNVARVVKMGIPRNHFVDCVSSGEVAYQSIRAKTAYLLGRDGEDYGFEPIRFVSDPREAEVMLILGSNAPETSMADYERLLAGVTLPAICCNPDKLMLTKHGLLPAPGAIADLYVKMGGSVRWIGKPYADIYRFALKRLGQPKRVLCIGDSAEHDVAGGRAAGLSTLLVQQGVSADVAEEQLEPRPDYVMKSFAWA
ncbi:MAG: TIGR01459 family HAD-type hydrolase [Proteobacteria bacterium]|nr:TIGR01459 family HAD-type hydrolase [Pseudomonadota bacterium]